MGSAWAPGGQSRRTRRAASLVRPHPVLLEAVLGAEKAVLDAQAKAFGALESAGIVFAIRTKALPLRGRFLGHGDRSGSRW